MVASSCFHIAEDPQLFVDGILIEATQSVTWRWRRPVLRRDRPRERWHEDLGEIDGKEHP